MENTSLCAVVTVKRTVTIAKPHDWAFRFSRWALANSHKYRLSDAVSICFVGRWGSKFGVGAVRVRWVRCIRSTIKVWGVVVGEDGGLSKECL